jgi:hypothetical protein
MSEVFIVLAGYSLLGSKTEGAADCLDMGMNRRGPPRPDRRAMRGCGELLGLPMSLTSWHIVQEVLKVVKGFLVNKKR